jgi:hypothetical protein
MIVYRYNLGETPDGLPILLDYRRDGDAGAYTLWLRDGDELHRVGVYPFAGPAEELGANHDAREDAVWLLTKRDEPPSHAEPLRDEPEALLGR